MSPLKIVKKKERLQTKQSRNMQNHLHRYGFTPTKEASALAADNPQSCQDKKYFKNNNLHKTAEKMIYDSTTDNGRDRCVDQYTQFTRNIHKNTPLTLSILSLIISVKFFKILTILYRPSKGQT
jgi:hypothetical protein